MPNVVHLGFWKVSRQAFQCTGEIQSVNWTICGLSSNGLMMMAQPGLMFTTVLKIGCRYQPC